jgi:hypothetical protein
MKFEVRSSKSEVRRGLGGKWLHEDYREAQPSGYSSSVLLSRAGKVLRLLPARGFCSLKAAFRHARHVLAFGLRISGFFRTSNFGLRTFPL